jgi:hypothetical protein
VLDAANVMPSAKRDIISRLKDEAELRDEGFVGKHGRPVVLKDWIEARREDAPHWWPASQGGGASGSQGGGGNGQVFSGDQQGYLNARAAWERGGKQGPAPVWRDPT